MRHVNEEIPDELALNKIVITAPVSAAIES
jgi:hypothetical protein